MPGQEQGPDSSVRVTDQSLPKAAATGPRQATAAEAAPSANSVAASAAASAAGTPAVNIPAAAASAAATPAVDIPAAAAEPATATGASASAGQSTAADSQTSASQTAAAKLRPSSKSADGAKPSVHADVRPTTSGRAAAAAAAAADSPAADINTAPAEPDEPYQQQPPSMLSDSSLAAHSMSTADMNATDATTSIPTAVRDTTDATPSDSTAELTAAAAIPFATFGSSSQADDDFFAAAGSSPSTLPASRALPSTAAAELPQHPPSAAAIDLLPTLSAPTDASSRGIQPQKQLDPVGHGKPNAGAVRQPQRAALPARHRGSADAAALQPPFLQQATAAAPPASVSDHHAQPPAVSSAASAASAVPATVTAPAAAKPSNKADVSPPPSLIATNKIMPTAVDPAINVQAEAVFSAGQALTFGGCEEPTLIPLDVEKEEDKAEQQSGFVPIPFGSSSIRPSFAATAVAAPFGSHADMDNMDDSFFDSIGTGTSHAQTLYELYNAQYTTMVVVEMPSAFCPSFGMHSCLTAWGLSH